jgi:hypothetical protein
MQQRSTTWILAIGLVLIAGAYWQIYQLRLSLDVVAERIEALTPIEEREMSTTYLAKVNGQPQSHTVTDTRNPGESVADFRKRHFEHVAADQDGDYPLWE